MTYHEVCRCGHVFKLHYAKSGIGRRMPCQKQISIGAVDTRRCTCGNWQPQ